MSVVLFLIYGAACLFAKGMEADFARFGLARVRLLTGALELLGALGLLVGQVIPELVIVSAGGLALLMALGVITRVRVRDSVLETLPAAVLMLLNAYIAWYALAV